MSSEAAPSPRIFPPVTPGESLNVLSWVLLCVTVLAKISRFGTKWAIIRKFEWDDLFAFFALVFSTGLTIAVSLQTANGLGLHFDELSRRDQERFQKATFASDILFVATLWAGKSATVWQMQQIHPFAWRLRLSQGFNIFLGLWALTAIVALGLQCSPPRWRFVVGSSCIDRTSLHAYVDVTNLITEAAVVVLAIAVLAKIKIPLQRKLAILACFALRIGTVAAIIAQLVYGGKGVYTSLDPTYDYWKRTVCLQIVQNVCVISCSVPYLKPFYMGLQSGLIRSDDMRRTGLSSSEYTQLSGEVRVSSKTNNR